MSISINAQQSAQQLRTREASSGRRPENDDTKSQDLVLSFLGSVNVGKSTLTGVLTKNVKDDGAGLARKLVMRFPHELEKGQTSSVTQNHMVLKNGRTVTFVDLAGHQKYLKTTMRGLNGYNIDYSIVLISAKQGITEMTKEHIKVARCLNHPTIIIITKIDIAPEHLYKHCIKELKTIIKNREYTGSQNIPYRINSEERMRSCLPLFLQENTRIMPVFEVSNTTGENIELLKTFLFSLPTRHNWLPYIKDKPIFTILEKFKVDNIGHIFYGRLIQGIVNKGDKLLIGPWVGKWLEVSVRSIHSNNRLPIERLETGKLGSISIKFHCDKDTISQFVAKRGTIITGLSNPLSHWYFLAKVYIVKSDRTTIKQNYQPMINCRTVSQCARVQHIFSRDLKTKKLEIDAPMRGGDRADIIFKFMIRPEHLFVNDAFIIRENNTRGIAVIKQLMTADEARDYYKKQNEEIS